MKNKQKEYFEGLREKAIEQGNLVHKSIENFLLEEKDKQDQLPYIQMYGRMSRKGPTINIEKEIQFEFQKAVELNLEQSILPPGVYTIKILKIVEANDTDVIVGTIIEEK
jgi:hypothetical protein